MEMADLVRRTETGDISAQEQLYMATSQRAYYLALRLLQNPEDAMDVVQESYIAAFTALDKLQNAEAFESWLARIVANRSKNLLRSRNRFVKTDTDNDEGRLSGMEDTDEAVLPQEALERGEIRRMVLGMVDALPDDQRECVMLYYFSGLTVEQIAQVQECSQGTVKSRLHYARRKLKEDVLLLEKRAGIRLHVFVPLNLFFSKYAVDMREKPDFGEAWQAVAGGMAAGGAGAGTAGGIAAGTAQTAGGLAAAGAKAGILAAKGKFIAAAILIAAGVTSAAVLRQNAPVVFHDARFEAAFAQASGLHAGRIRKSDLRGIETIAIYEGNIYLDEEELYELAAEESPYRKALENPGAQWPEMDLTDLKLFPSLKSVSLEFMTAENNGVLKELELESLSLAGARLESWEAVNGLETLESLSVLLSSAEDGALDFSRLTELRDVVLAAGDSSEWERTFKNIGGAKKIQMFEALCYEGSPDLLFFASLPELAWCNLSFGGTVDLEVFAQNEKLRSIYLDAGIAGAGTEILRRLPALECAGLQEIDYFEAEGVPCGNEDMLSIHEEIALEILDGMD